MLIINVRSGLLPASSYNLSKHNNLFLVVYYLSFDKYVFSEDQRQS